MKRKGIERELMKQEAERRRTEMMRVFGGRRDGNGPPDGDLDIDNFQMFEQFMRDPVLLEMLRQQAEGDFRPEPEEEGQDEWEDDLQEESEGAEEQDEANNPNRMREEPL